MFKSANRKKFTEISWKRVRVFFDDTELFLELCGRSRDRWVLLVLSLIGVNEAEKVRRRHLAEKLEKNDLFWEGIITLF